MWRFATRRVRKYRFLFPLLLLRPWETYLPCSWTCEVSRIFPTLETGGTRQRTYTYVVAHISRLVVNPSSNRTPGPPKLGSLFIIFLSFLPLCPLSKHMWRHTNDSINPRLIVFLCDACSLEINKATRVFRDCIFVSKESNVDSCFRIKI